MRFRNIPERDPETLVKDYGHIKLSAACVRANQTGFFALGERVQPDSFDGNDTNINAKDCFFGGRRIDIALTLKDASELAARSPEKPDPADGGSGSSADEGAKD